MNTERTQAATTIVTLTIKKKKMTPTNTQSPPPLVQHGKIMAIYHVVLENWTL